MIFVTCLNCCASAFIGNRVWFGFQNIVHSHPYHIDSLMQLSEVFHMNEDAQTAVDLIGQFLCVCVCVCVCV